MSTTMTLKDGYSCLKTPPTAEYRTMTPDEAKSLRVGQELQFANWQRNTVRRCRVSGVVKTWKRDGRVEVPCKYGMYESGRSVGSEMIANGGAVLVIPVAGSQDEPVTVCACGAWESGEPHATDCPARVA